MSPHVRIILTMLAVFLIINFLVALLVGSLESLNYTDAFYLTMTTSTLCGAKPATSVAGKWFLSFFQLVSYGLLFYTLTMISDSRFANKDYCRR